MLAQPGKQPRLHRLHLRLFDPEPRFRFRPPRPRRIHHRPQPLQLRVHVKHQVPACDGHGSRVTHSLTGDEPRGFRRFLQAPQIPAPHPRVARVGGLRQTVQPAAQPGVGARLRDGPALVFPEGDARRNPILGGVGRKQFPRRQPALLRDRAQHRRENTGHSADIAQRRVRAAFQQAVILVQGLQLAVPSFLWFLSMC